MRILDKNRSIASPGGPVAKSTFITLIKVQDLKSAPVTNAKGVLQEGLFEMKEGTEPLNIYNTGSFQNLSFETDGDEDAGSIQKTLTARFPGDGLEIREHVVEYSDVEIIAVFGGGCGSGMKTVLGAKCAPIKMRANFTMDNDNTHYELTFSNMSNDNLVPGLYNGPDPVANAYEASSVNLDLTQANGRLVQLPSSSTGEAVDVVSIDFETGDFVTILGGGGDDAAVISSTGGATNAALPILKDGTPFIGLEGARITFEVIAAGAETYLVERSRQ